MHNTVFWCSLNALYGWAGLAQVEVQDANLRQRTREASGRHVTLKPKTVQFDLGSPNLQEVSAAQFLEMKALRMDTRPVQRILKTGATATTEGKDSDRLRPHFKKVWTRTP